MASPAERDEFLEYFAPSGAITCRVLYRMEQLVFVQFRTVDWPGYRDFSNYARVALLSEHLRPADPRSPGVMNFVQAIAREIAAQQRYLSDRRHHGAPSGSLTHKLLLESHKNLTNLFPEHYRATRLVTWSARPAMSRRRLQNHCAHRSFV